MIFLLITTCFLQLQCSTSSGQEPKTKKEWDAGDIYKDENGWIEAHVGNMPLVVSAPHGGTLKPDGISDRNCSGIVTVRDMNTIELALQVEKELLARYNKQPFIVLNYLHRSKLDMNRDVGEATCGNEKGEAPWYQYHEYIQSALEHAIDEFGYAIFIDLHGHGHDKQRLELGYALSKQEIRDSHLDESAAGELVLESSLKNLMNLNPELNFQDLLTGEYAFGTLMEAESIAAVPSMDDPYPLKEDPYFTGGYNTRRYTSTDYPRVFGWQIEANYKGLRSSKEGRQSFSEAFAKAVTTFIEVNVAKHQ